MRPISSWKMWHKSNFWKLQINRQEGSVTSERNRPLLCSACQAQQNIPSTASLTWLQFLLCTQTISLGGLEVPLRKGLPGTQWLRNRSGCNYSESSGQKPGNTSCLLGTLWRTREGEGAEWMADVKLPASTALQHAKQRKASVCWWAELSAAKPRAQCSLPRTAAIKQETHTD